MTESFDLLTHAQLRDMSETFSLISSLISVNDQRSGQKYDLSQPTPVLEVHTLTKPLIFTLQREKKEKNLNYSWAV